VILASAGTQAAADGLAGKLSGRVRDIGVLDTGQHPEMTPHGVWEVYAGRYPTYVLAEAAATQADHHGESAARPSLVQRPGRD
jgi:hypothetical protein